MVAEPWTAIPAGPQIRSMVNTSARAWGAQRFHASSPSSARAACSFSRRSALPPHRGPTRVWLKSPAQMNLVEGARWPSSPGSARDSQADESDRRATRPAHFTESAPHSGATTISPVD